MTQEGRNLSEFVNKENEESTPTTVVVPTTEGTDGSLDHLDDTPVKVEIKEPTIDEYIASEGYTEGVPNMVLDRRQTGLSDMIANTLDEFDAVGAKIEQEKAIENIDTEQEDEEAPKTETRVLSSPAPKLDIQEKGLIADGEDYITLMSATRIPAKRGPVISPDAKVIPKVRKDRKKAVAVRRKRDRIDAVSSAQIVALQSGYWAVMSGMSGSEIRNIRNPLGSDEFTRFRNRFEVYFDKMTSNSAGIRTFEEFLENTSMLDIDVFDWGLFNATYPKINKYPLLCNNRDCELNADMEERKPFIVSEDTENLLVPPTAEAENRIIGIVNDENGKEKYYDKSAMKVTSEFTLDDGYIKIFTNMPSLADFLDTISDSKSGKFQRQYPKLVGYLPYLSLMHIYDEDEGGFVEYSTSDTDDLDIIFQNLDGLSDEDLTLLESKITKDQDLYTINFAIQGATCPHCKTHYDEIEINFTTMLFMMDEVREATTTEA